MTEGRDRLYAESRPRVDDFMFDERVAEVFDDMIRRSVPGYGSIVAMTGVVAAEYAQAGSRCYDLGCSLGATTVSMLRHLKAPDCRIVAADNAPAMIEKCRANLQNASGGSAVDLVCADIRSLSIEDASVVVLNFTLQFLPPSERDALIARIHGGLRRDGVVILSEKISSAGACEEVLMTRLHHGFKRANGYSSLEISQKRAALEKVLVPESIETHEARLKDAGFRHVIQWFRCLNFASVLAVR